MPRQATTVDPRFGRRLRELRQQRGLSLRRLGQQVHCSHGYLWDLEAGGKRPSPSVAALLDAALGAERAVVRLATVVSADTGGQPGSGEIEGSWPSVRARVRLGLAARRRGRG